MRLRPVADPVAPSASVRDKKTPGCGHDRFRGFHYFDSATGFLVRDTRAGNTTVQLHSSQQRPSLTGHASFPPRQLLLAATGSPQIEHMRFANGSCFFICHRLPRRAGAVIEARA